MDPLELSYDSIDDVPEAFRPLYSEQDGAYTLSNINGLKTDKDVANLQEALRKERNDRSRAEQALKPWAGLGSSPDEIQSIIDRVPELEAAASGATDDEKVSKLVEARLGQKTGPLERRLKEYSEKLTTFEEENNVLKNSILSRDRNDAVRAIATEMKVLPTAIADVELVAGLYLEREESTGSFIVKNDSNGVTPGLDVRGFMKEMQKVRPHWWPNSNGGGALGGNSGGDGGGNPWSSNSWSLTEQGRVVKEHGLSKASEMAKSAGSFVGATGPRKK